LETIKIKATVKSKEQIFKLAGEYAANYEKENGYTTHPKTASFHGYIAGYDDAKLETPAPTGDRDRLIENMRIEIGLRDKAIEILESKLGDRDCEELLLSFCHFLGKAGYKINGYDDSQLLTVINQFKAK